MPISDERPNSKVRMTEEQKRLQAHYDVKAGWLNWGPYLSERQWGTVREDYSEHGTAWDSFPHEMARSRAYRWGEDGIGGYADREQLICFSLALWNGKDPILKERLFGVTGSEGNHGEDVKEYYYYLDSTPTHSYMKMLYKYPQTEFPYARLVEESRRRGKKDPEFELSDCGLFENNRYFDVFIEYAKAGPEDTLIQITAHNRGSETAELHLLPQLLFRNSWSWSPASAKPILKQDGKGLISVQHPTAGQYFLYYEDGPAPLYCDNDTNHERISGLKGIKGYFKDGVNNCVVSGDEDAVNPAQIGTKVALHQRFAVAPGSEVSLRLRLSKEKISKPFSDFEKVFTKRLNEADEFYASLQQHIPNEDWRNVQRQAYAGLLWSKQFYNYDVRLWLDGDPGQPAPPRGRKEGRNRGWGNLRNADIISMPDKWEYPWYAAWDLAFHCVAFTAVDSEFAKQQLLLLLRDRYMHPNGQIPAYEWAFGDVNPPVHAWAGFRVYKIEKKMHGKGDLEFLEALFHRLLLNFTWWVNRKDEEGHNVFQGGFLGLDNIGVFDRGAMLPQGGHLEQSDGTAWMGMYCLNMMRIALELSLYRPVYQDLACKFLEHFLNIAQAMVNIGGQGVTLWDDEDKFYYDVLHLPNGDLIPIKLRTLVGLIPLFAAEVIEPELLDKTPVFKERLEWLLANRTDLADLVSRWQEPRAGERRLLSLLRGHRMKRLLARMLNETEFLSSYGVRGLSREYKDTPYEFRLGDDVFTVRYTPAESDTELFGGNSNWRGPIWFPVNYLIIEALQRFHHYYGDDFKIEFPKGSGKLITIREAGVELARRLVSIFTRDNSGRRAVFGANEKFQNDPHFRDYLLFYEYFDGDSGRGVGASHQTGWTALVAKLIHHLAFEKDAS